MTVATEQEQVVSLFEDVESLEVLAATFDAHDDRREKLMELIARSVHRIPPVRPSIAADLLSLSEPTIRAWVKEGVLAPAASERRLLLDPERLHQVFHVVQALREAGKTQGLLDAVYRRLVDSAWGDNDDLVESLAQMRRGEGQRVRTAPVPPG